MLPLGKLSIVEMCVARGQVHYPTWQISHTSYRKYRSELLDIREYSCQHLRQYITPTPRVCIGFPLGRVFIVEEVLNLNTAAVQNDLYLAVTETGHKVGVRGSVSYLPSQLINPSPHLLLCPHRPPPFTRCPVTVHRRPNIECGIAAVSLLFLECSGYVEFNFVCR